MRQRFLFLMGCALMVMAGCAQTLPPAPPSRIATSQPASSPLLTQPFVMPTPAEGMTRIRGVITQIRNVGSAAGPAMEIRIAEQTQAGRGRDVAVVTVTTLASVTTLHDGQRTRASLDVLTVGQIVEAGLSELMKPANPIQANALEVTILE